MSQEDRNTIQQTLKLDITNMNANPFSFASRDRLYLTNFDCLPDSDLPPFDESPTLFDMSPGSTAAAEPAPPAWLSLSPLSEDEISDYFQEGVTDKRFMRESRGSRGRATPFGKTGCILPDKGEDIIMARLNARLRAIKMAPDQNDKLSKEEVGKIRGKNMLYVRNDSLGYLQLRLLTVRERELGLGFPLLPSREGWTSSARSERIRRNQLGESFEVRNIMWRLRPIVEELQRRCHDGQRPLRVLSICDGIAGLLAALLGIGGWAHGITYVAIEKDSDCRSVVRHNCDQHGEATVRLRQLPQCDDAAVGRCCADKCRCGDLLTMLPNEACGLNSGAELFSFLEHHADGPIDLCVSGYPCKGHSSANRQRAGALASYLVGLRTLTVFALDRAARAHGPRLRAQWGHLVGRPIHAWGAVPRRVRMKDPLLSPVATAQLSSNAVL